MLGLTPIRKRFKEHLPGTAEVLMTIDDCVVSRGGHIPDEDLPEIKARYKQSERATRLYGADMAGEGLVFEIPEDAIRYSRDPITFPDWWPWLWAVDFSHGGMSAQAHPFAAVLGCWDRDADCIYVCHAIRMRQALPVMHVAALKQHPCWDAPVSYGHDGGHTGFETPRLSRRPTSGSGSTCGRRTQRFRAAGSISSPVLRRWNPGSLPTGSRLPSSWARSGPSTAHITASPVWCTRSTTTCFRRSACSAWISVYAKVLAPDRPGYGFRRPETERGRQKR